MGCNNGGLFGGNSDWIWIIVAIVIVFCLCGDNNGGLFGSENHDCCC